MEKLLGGDQNIWSKKEGYKWLARYGCGTVLMCDAEYILSGDTRFPAIINTDEYINYVETAFRGRYRILPNPFPFMRGLTPWQMRLGIKKKFGKTYSVRWAGAGFRKKAVMNEITRMLKEGLPVICSYFSFSKKGLALYRTSDTDRPCSYVNNHYMRIYDYSKKSGLFTFISWGQSFFVRADDYLSHIGPFTNILVIKKV